MTNDRRRSPCGRLALLASLLVLPALVGCGENKQASVEAAERLAERLYPGRLEIYDTRWRLDEDRGHDVVFAIKGDPVTRIRLAVDKDPAACVAASPCEDRFRAAYEEGVARAGELRAIERSFRACGTPVLSIDELRLQQPPKSPQTLAVRVTLAMELTTATRAAAEAQLATCVAGFGRERAGLPWSDRGAYVTAQIIPAAQSGEIAPPEPLTFEARPPTGEKNAAFYAQPFKLEGETAMALPLRFAPRYSEFRKLENEIAARAEAFLREAGLDKAGGQGLVFRATLDPVRVDVIRGYVLACSVKPEKPPCRADVAVRFRHDFSSGETAEFELLRDIRDARNVIFLPPLPGS